MLYIPPTIQFVHFQLWDVKASGRKNLLYFTGENLLRRVGHAVGKLKAIQPRKRELWATQSGI